MAKGLLALTFALGLSALTPAWAGDSKSSSQRLDYSRYIYQMLKSQSTKKALPNLVFNLKSDIGDFYAYSNSYSTQDLHENGLDQAYVGISFTIQNPLCRGQYQVSYVVMGKSLAEDHSKWITTGKFDATSGDLSFDAPLLDQPSRIDFSLNADCPVTIGKIQAQVIASKAYKNIPSQFQTPLDSPDPLKGGPVIDDWLHLIEFAGKMTSPTRANFFSHIERTLKTEIPQILSARGWRIDLNYFKSLYLLVRSMEPSFEACESDICTFILAPAYHEVIGEFESLVSITDISQVSTDLPLARLLAIHFIEANISALTPFLNHDQIAAIQPLNQAIAAALKEAYDTRGVLQELIAATSTLDFLRKSARTSYLIQQLDGITDWLEKK